MRCFLTSVPSLISYCDDLGDVAQLGERRVRNAKVVGSSPVASSSHPAK